MKPLSHEARALLDAARAGEDPSDVDLARIRRQLLCRVGSGAAAIVATSSTAAAASAGSPATTALVGFGGLFGKIGAVVVLLGALGGGAAVALRAAAPGRAGLRAVRAGPRRRGAPGGCPLPAQSAALAPLGAGPLHMHARRGAVRPLTIPAAMEGSESTRPERARLAARDVTF